MIVLDTKGDPGKFNLIGSIMSYCDKMILFEATSLNFSGRVRLPKEAYGRAGRRMSAMAAVSIRKPSWP